MMIIRDQFDHDLRNRSQNNDEENSSYPIPTSE